MRKIKNIEQVEKILEENNIKIKNDWIFHNFWIKVDIKDNKRECWNWIASTIWGYGQFFLNHDNPVRSHRMAYVLTKGTIYNGLQVQHLCNNRKCCNPLHLKLGTPSENIRYMVKCERQSTILTEDQVIKIRKIHKDHPGLKQWQIAEMFKISQAHISNIINGEGIRWKTNQILIKN